MAITFYIFISLVLIIALNIISSFRKKDFNNEISELEKSKNLIISANILTELNKVETLINTDKLRKVYEGWQTRFKELKDKEIIALTNSLIEVEGLYNQNRYSELKQKMTEVELQIFYIKTKAEFLLKEIQEITLSEEKNREKITKLKTIYRELKNKYRDNVASFSSINKPIELQFENVDKLFTAFENAMDSNAYSEVAKIIKGLDDIIGNLQIVVEEAPSIILLGEKIIPKKEDHIKKQALKMMQEGFNLDFLNIDYNLEECGKKITDIFAKLNVLNVEDSIFELKTISSYLDGLYNDFDLEKVSRKLFEPSSRETIIKILHLLKISNELFKKIAEIKYNYDVEDKEVQKLTSIREKLMAYKIDYEKIINLQRSKTIAYSKLSRELEILNIKLSETEDELEVALRIFGSLKEDELRAREQLDEIKKILSQTKRQIRAFKLPIIPKQYLTELSEATLAILEITKELEKRPIAIEVLNTRVDTARDLALKLFNTTKEIVKAASLAEKAIIYGNRYRAKNGELNLALEKAQIFFQEGEYKVSLKEAIKGLNIVDPNIFQKLKEKHF